MSRAILTCFHMYTPDWGQEFYDPILQYYLQNMRKYKDEYDQLYLIDSNWNIPESPDYKIIKVSPHLRYYDAFKEVLPQIKEDTVLLLDDDTLIWKEGRIEGFFKKLEEGYDIAGIYNSIGYFHSPILNGNSKFCPYLLCTRKDLLMKYRDIDWSPDKMPQYETLGEMSQKMIEDGVKPFEVEEDFSSLSYDGRMMWEDRPIFQSKQLGYYHVRSGSLPALLLACKKEGREEFAAYIKNQPQMEYLRQCAWYWIIGGEKYLTEEFMKDLGVDYTKWKEYIIKFKKFHGWE